MDGNQCSILSNDDKRASYFLKFCFFSECHVTFLQPYQNVALGLEHGELLPLKHFSGSQCLLRLSSHLCFLLEWTSSMRSTSTPRDPTGFSLYIQDSSFKRNHIYLPYRQSNSIVYYQNLDPFPNSRTTYINWGSTGKIKSHRPYEKKPIKSLGTIHQWIKHSVTWLFLHM